MADLEHHFTIGRLERKLRERGFAVDEIAALSQALSAARPGVDDFIPYHVQSAMRMLKWTLGKQANVMSAALMC